MIRFNIDNGLSNPDCKQGNPFILIDLAAVLLVIRDRLPFITAPDKIPGPYLIIVSIKNTIQERKIPFEQKIAEV